ncbi:MAG: hypothetical protein RIC51_11620 [Erythrobacter sp.]|uniref:DUF2946 family protein n=1 Tax=Erythrobacter sp. TaxID=1042 RepID=UPI0032EE9C75
MTFAVMVVVLLASILVPRGYMVSPSPTDVFEITACPETNPLARIVADSQSQEHRQAHAAMGHHMDPADDDPSTGTSGSDCAFAGFGAQGLAQDDQPWGEPARLHEAPQRPLHTASAERRLLRLRPPLRAPPVSI